MGLWVQGCGIRGLWVYEFMGLGFGGLGVEGLRGLGIGFGFVGWIWESRLKQVGRGGVSASASTHQDYLIYSLDSFKGLYRG